MRRSKFSIYLDILRLINSKGGKAKPTHILYGANLSYGRMKSYLDMLSNESLLEKTVEGGHTFLKLTEKGRNFLNQAKTVKQFSEAFGIAV